MHRRNALRLYHERRGFAAEIFAFLLTISELFHSHFFEMIFY